MDAQLVVNKDVPEIWNDKKVFPILHQKGNDFLSKLHETGIKNIYVFDHLGVDWDLWVSDDCLALCILPINTNVNQTGNKTREKLITEGFPIHEYMYPIDIISDQYGIDQGYTLYFPTKNIIIAKVNPFFSESMFNLVLNDIYYSNVRYYNKEERERRYIEDYWEIRNNESIQELENNMQREIKNSEDIKARLRSSYRIYLNLKNRLDYIKSNLGNKNIMFMEIEKIKKLPFIKEIKINDNIELDYGDIYITTNVITDKEKKDGIVVPIVSKEKVYIGKIKFIITPNKIKVINPNAINGIQHPHARDNEICFGYEKLEAESLLASLQLEKLAIFLYSWCMSYNKDSAFGKIEEFYNKMKQ